MSHPIPATLPLTVDFGDARPVQPFPVRGGVPFAQGVVRSIDNVRLLADAAERECQVTRTAMWPDGSVKWVLLDFFTMVGEPLTLEYGAGVTRQPISERISMTHTTDAVSLDTGILQVLIRKSGSGFLDEVRLNDEVVVAAVEQGERRHVLDFVRTVKTEDRLTNTAAFAGTPDPSQVEIESLDVEEHGPLHAVVLMRGVYCFRSVGSTIAGVIRKGGGPFTLRLHVWRGSSLIGVEHFFHYEGDPDVDFIRQIGLGLTTSLARGDRTVTFGTEQRRGSGFGVRGSGRTRMKGQAMGLHQASSDHYEVWQASDDDKTVQVIHSGHRASGWVDVSGVDGGVACGVRAFWQQYEKSLHVDLETGRMDVWLWPPEAQTLDVRRYAREWGVGEDGAQDGPLPCNYRLAGKGVGKSHELLFSIHRGDAKAADVEQVFRAFDARPLVLAPPAHYAASRALGSYHARSAGRFTDLEKVIQRPIDYLRDARERFRWYGFFDFGDVQTCFATFHHHDRWENDFGRWGWGNGDQVGRLNYALMLQFIRTGDRANFEFAEANMRHVHDVDATHTTEYPFRFGEELRDLSGCVHRHNAQHWACPYVGSRGAHPVGAKIHYFVTGSGRSKDILDEVLALSERLPEGGLHDGHGASAQSFLCAWERTGDPQYRDRTLQILQEYGIERIHGGWMAMISAAFGVFDAMVEYTDLAGDEQFIPNILDFAEMCMGPEIENNWTYPGGYFRIYAEALRYSSSARSLAGIAAARARLNDMMRQSFPYLPRTQWPAPAGAGGGAFSNFSIDANTLRDLPFLMGALVLNGVRS